MPKPNNLGFKSEDLSINSHKSRCAKDLRQGGDPLDPSNYVIPDAVAESGKPEEKANGQGGKVVHYFWWNEGAFIDAKTSESNNIQDSEQLRSFVDILASNNEAETATNMFQAMIGWGTDVKKNAAESVAAFLHIITPAKTTISKDFLDYAKSKGVQVWQSETEVHSGGEYIRVLPAKPLNSGGLMHFGSFLQGVQPGKLDYNQK